MATEKNIPNLTINKVENQNVFDYLVTEGLVNENELYLIPGEAGGGVQDVYVDGESIVDPTDNKAYLGVAASKGVDSEIVSVHSGDLPTSEAVVGYVLGATVAEANTLKTYFYNRNNSTNVWFKVATTTITKTASQWPEKHAFLFIKGSHNSNYGQNGIIAIDAMGNGQSGQVGSYGAQFMSATSSLNLENFYIEYLNGNSSTDGIVNFWIRANTNNYASWQVKILQNSGWEIGSSGASMTAMPSTGYTGKNAILAGSVARSIGDKNGNDIATTYYLASNPKGYTTNTGTITGITMNGASKGTSGVVDLGTVITSHQDISGKVNKAGDNMSGILSMRDPVIDSTLENNGISSTFYPTTFNICDKNGKTMTRMEAAVESSGDISAYWYVRNYGTDGTLLGQKGIRMRMKKDSTFSYTVDDQAAFRTAITAVCKSGDTMTGALNFANGVANKVGDDVSIGDFNKSGLLGVMGQNGTTGIALIKNGSTWSASAERAEMRYNSTDKCIEFVFA